MQLWDHARIPEQLLQGLPDHCIEALRIVPLRHTGQHDRVLCPRAICDKAAWGPVHNPTMSRRGACVGHML